MEQTPENNSWHDNMISLNHMLALRSAELATNFEMQTTYCEALEKKLESVIKDYGEMEKICANKEEQLAQYLKINELYETRIQSLSSTISTKESQLCLLRNINEAETEKNRKYQERAEEVHRAWDNTVNDLKAILECVPYAKQRTELEKLVAERKETLSNLFDKINKEKRRRYELQEIRKKQEQEVIVKFASLMLDYNSMRETAYKLNEYEAIELERKKEAEEKMKLAPKRDNIFSEGVKEIDSLLNADYLTLSPLKSINIEFNSDDELEKRDLQDEDFNICLRKRKVSVEFMEPKKICSDYTDPEPELDEGNNVSSLISENKIKYDLPLNELRGHSACEIESTKTPFNIQLNNLNTSKKPTPAKTLDANKQNIPPSTPKTPINNLNYVAPTPTSYLTYVAQTPKQSQEATKLNVPKQNENVQSTIVNTPIAFKVPEEKKYASTAPGTPQQVFQTPRNATPMMCGKLIPNILSPHFSASMKQMFIRDQAYGRFIAKQSEPTDHLQTPNTTTPNTDIQKKFDKELQTTIERKKMQLSQEMKIRTPTPGNKSFNEEETNNLQVNRVRKILFQPSKTDQKVVQGFELKKNDISEQKVMNKLPETESIYFLNNKDLPASYCSSVQTPPSQNKSMLQHELQNITGSGKRSVSNDSIKKFDPRQIKKEPVKELMDYECLQQYEIENNFNMPNTSSKTENIDYIDLTNDDDDDDDDASDNMPSDSTGQPFTLDIPRPDSAITINSSVSSTSSASPQEAKPAVASFGMFGSKFTKNDASSFNFTFGESKQKAPTFFNMF